MKLKNNLTLLFLLMLTFVFLFSNISLSSASDLDFRLDAELEGTYTTFYAETDSGSLTGYDGNDAELPDNPEELPAVLYSSVGGRNLLIDSWPTTLSSRTLYLVYYIPAKSLGRLTLSWNNVSNYRTMSIVDYNDDSAYTDAVRTITVTGDGEYTLNQNNGNGLRYLKLVTTYNPPSNGTGSSTGGGGGAKAPRDLISIDVPHPISIESTGPVEFNLTLENIGDTDFQNVHINGTMFLNSKLLNNPIVYSRTFFGSFIKGQKETITVKTEISSEEISVYEIVTNVEAEKPEYVAQGKVYITYMGKNAAGIVKIIAFTEGLIEENSECFELKDMVEDAKKSLNMGDPKTALETAQKALEACKRILEGPKKPLLSQLTQSKIFFYFIGAVIVAVAVGILFNLYRFWKFRGFRRYASFGSFERGQRFRV